MSFISADQQARELVQAECRFTAGCNLAHLPPNSFARQLSSPLALYLACTTLERSTPFLLRAACSLSKTHLLRNCTPSGHKLSCMSRQGCGWMCRKKHAVPQPCHAAWNINARPKAALRLNTHTSFSRAPSATDGAQEWFAHLNFEDCGQWTKNVFDELLATGAVRPLIIYLLGVAHREYVSCICQVDCCAGCCRACAAQMPTVSGAGSGRLKHTQSAANCDSHQQTLVQKGQSHGATSCSCPAVTSRQQPHDVMG